MEARAINQAQTGRLTFWLMRHAGLIGAAEQRAEARTRAHYYYIQLLIGACFPDAARMPPPPPPIPILTPPCRRLREAAAARRAREPIIIMNDVPEIHKITQHSKCLGASANFTAPSNSYRGESS